MIKYLIGAVFIWTAALVPNAQANPTLVAKLEQQIKGLKSAKGRFRQTDDIGRYIDGSFFIAKPGYMRFDYDKPSPIVLISDGYWVAQVDVEMESTAHKKFSETPLKYILGNDINLNRDLKLVSTSRQGGVNHLKFVERNPTTDGHVTLFVDDNGDLKGWNILDPLGETVNIVLTQMSKNVKLKRNLFNIPDYD